jgi:hypothetical protein
MIGANQNTSDFYSSSDDPKSRYEQTRGILALLPSDIANPCSSMHSGDSFPA